MEKKQKATKYISCAGLALLAAAFIFWCLNCGKGLPYVLFALVSAGLFAAVCLRFVPHWVDFWTDYTDSVPKPKNYKNDAIAAAYALAMCFAVLILAWLIKLCTGWQGSFRDSVQLWMNLDSRHYLDIARDWYVSEGDWDRMVQLVFLPGYPLAVFFVKQFVGDFLSAGLLVSALCFAYSAVVLYELMRLDTDEATALRTVKYLCLLPSAFFFAAPMSESMFLALSLTCIYCMRRGNWWVAGNIGAIAAFTRSMGLLLIVPILFELFHIKLTRRDRLRRSAAMLMVLGGFALYCLICFRVSGSPFKFLEYQSVHWGQKLGWFFNTAAYQLENAVGYFASGHAKEAIGLWCANIICCVASLVLMLFGIRKLRPSYGAYFLCYYIVAIGATWLLSAPRYLAVMFPIPAALAVICKSKGRDLAATLGLGASLVLYLTAFVLGWQVW